MNEFDRAQGRDETGPKKESERRRSCVDLSLRNHKPSFMVSMGEGVGFEERYIGQEVVRDWTSFTFLIPLVDERVQEHVTSLRAQNNTQSLTDEILSGLYTKEYQNKRDIGISLRDRAQELGLITTQTPSQLAPRLQEPGRLSRDIDGTSLINDFSLQGWRIYTTDGKSSYSLVVPKPDDQGVQQLEVVDIDRLYEADPEFVKEQIYRFHQAKETSAVIRRVTNNLAVHNVDENQLIPEFFDKFDPDPEKRQKEVRQLSRFLTWVGSMKADEGIKVDNFVNAIKRREVKVSQRYERRIDIDEYLDHKTDCPSESDETKKQLFKVKTIYDAFSTINMRDLPQLPGQKNSKEMLRFALLQDPLDYTSVILDESRQNLRMEKENDTRFSQFTRDIKESNDTEQFERALQERMPDITELVNRFGEWLHVAGEGADLQSFITQAAESLQNSQVAYTKELVVDVIQRKLCEFIPIPGEQFEGVVVDRASGMISNEDLKDALTLEVITVAKQSLGSGDKRFDPVIERIDQDRSDYIEAVDTSLGELVDKRVVMGSLLEQNGISNEKVKILAELAIAHDQSRKVNRGESSFRVLFNAAVFASEGNLDVQSPVVRVVLKEVFPNITDEMIDVLAQS